jgi:hypothetical protein
MYKKSVVAVAVMLLAAVFIVAAWRVPRASKALATQPAIEIVTNQLPVVGGGVPVEIVDAKITDEVGEGQKPSPLGSLKFGVKNNTVKPMNAVVVKIVVDAFRRDGSISTNTVWFTLNQAIHVDIVTHHGQKPIGPGQVFTSEPDSLELGPTLVGIKSITFSIDYADFEDGSVIGPNARGTEQVVEVRRGAEKYKAWLVERYLQSGKSEAAIVALLRTQQRPSQGPPQGPPLIGSETRGANRYRKHLLDAYNMHGAAVFTKYLEAKQ